MSTVELLGKPIGSDRQENKRTYMALMGKDGCEKAVRELTQFAKTILGEAFEDTAFLCALADALSVRVK
jgi:geranylgeranyl diphosphate synthase type II